MVGDSNAIQELSGQDIILGNRYARKNDGTYFYPKDRFGNEYMDDNLKMIENNGEYIYPFTVSGKPNYRVEDSNQIYEEIDGKQIIGADIFGKQYYAINKLGNEYYPNDNIPARLPDGTFYYASNSLGMTVFPQDLDGNEYYFSEVDLAKPLTIPNRYALSNTNDEIYPIKLTTDGNKSQHLINNIYAVKRDKKPFYPKDGFNNEYYRNVSALDTEEYTRSKTISKILLDRYALTNDGKIILPRIGNNFYINENIEPKILSENVIGLLVRDDGHISDYLTNVSDTNFKPVDIKPYIYRNLITTEVLQSDQPSTTVNVSGILNTPFHKKWSFWIFLVVIIKSIIIGCWLYFFQKERGNIFDKIRS